MNADHAKELPPRSTNPMFMSDSNSSSETLPHSSSSDESLATQAPEQDIPTTVCSCQQSIESTAAPIPTSPQEVPETESERAVAEPSGNAALLETVGQGIGQIVVELQEYRHMIETLQKRLEAVESAVVGTSKQISFIPPQVSMVGEKVDAITTSISHARCRSLLDDVLRIHDLVDQVLRTSETGNGLPVARDNLEMLRTQLRQILEVNGLSQIPAQGLFDPRIHRAIGRVPCDDPSRANQVIRVTRPGFRTESRVLRYAEVEVSYYGPQTVLSQPAGQAESTPTPEAGTEDKQLALGKMTGQTESQAEDRRELQWPDVEST